MKSFFVRVLLFSCFAGSLRGQSLEAVLSSIQERHHVAEWRFKVAATLEGTTGTTVTPISWGSAAEYPTSGSLASLSMSERVSLLNKAVVEFEKVAPSYLQIATISGKEKLDHLESVRFSENQRLPRVTVANYHAVLQELALRVDTLRVLPWMAKYSVATADEATISSKTYPESRSWGTNPFTQIGTYCNERQDAYFPSYFGGSPGTGIVYGPTLVTAIVSNLGTGSGISGKLVPYLKHEYSVATDVTVRGHKVKQGEGWLRQNDGSGGVTIPSPSFTMGWVDHPYGYLIPAGLSGVDVHVATPGWLFADDSSWQVNGYNGKWMVLCEPEFQKGLSTEQTALATLRELRRTPACEVVVNPRQGVTLEIPGLGTFAAGSPRWEMAKYYQDQFTSPATFLLPMMVSDAESAWISPAFRGPKFYSSGQPVDVRYEIGFDPLKRVPMLAWGSADPLTSREGWPSYRGYYAYWQQPRLRQVIGEDVVVDVDYDSTAKSDYNTVVKVYRVPLSGITSTEDGMVDVAGLALWKEYRFKGPASTTSFATSALKLNIEEVGGLTHEIEWTVSATPTEDPMDHPPSIKSWKDVVKDGESEVRSYEVEIGKDEESEKMKIVCERKLNNVALPTQTWEMDGEVLTERPASYEEKLESKSRKWTFTYPGSASYGTRFPSVATLDDDSDPDGSIEWNSDGTLKSMVSGSWSEDFSYAGGTCSIQSKYSGSLYQRGEIKWASGAAEVTSTTTPDGSTSIGSGAWTKVTLNTGSGIPWAPTNITRSDGTAVAFTYTGTTAVETADSRGGISRKVTMNARGYPTSEVVKFGSLQIGGGTYSEFTDWGAPQKMTHHTGGVEETWSYSSNGERLASHTDTMGVEQSWTYDAAGRVSDFEWNGFGGSTTYDGLEVSTSIAGAGLSSSVTYDAFGKAMSGSSNDGQNVTWEATEDSGERSVDITNGATTGTLSQTFSKVSGSLTGASGNTLPASMTGGMSINNGLFMTTSSVGGLDATTWTDAWGRVRKTSGPGNRSTTVTYSSPNSSTARQIVVDGSGRTTITEREVSSGTVRSGVDLNNGQSLGSGDRYSETTISASSGAVLTITRATEPGGFNEIVRTSYNPATGKTVTLLHGGEEEIESTPDFDSHTVATSSDSGWTKNASYSNLGQFLASSASGTGMPHITASATYNDAGRQVTGSQTAGPLVSGAEWNDDGTLDSLSSSLRSGNMLSGHGFSSGKETITVEGRTFENSLNGLSQSQSGGDGWGVSSTTTLGSGGIVRTLDPSGGSNTVQTFSPAGDEVTHAFPSGSDTASYGNSGQVLSSTSDGQTTGYSYNNALDLTGISYPTSAGAPPRSVGIGRGAAGEPTSISDPNASIAYRYARGRVIEENYGGFSIGGFTIERSYDSRGRQVLVQLKRSGAPVCYTTYGYNGDSDEIASVESSGITEGYTRQSGTRAITAVDNGSFGQTWGRDSYGRATSAGSTLSGFPEVTGTTFDSKGRRRFVTNSEGVWEYGYSAGQLIEVSLDSGSGPSTIYSYTYDGIGARTSSSGKTYTPNSLNQLTSRSRNQSATLHITADPTATVKINGVTESGFTGLTTKTLTASSSAGEWVGWEVEGRLTGGGLGGADRISKQSGFTWLPPATESYSHSGGGLRTADSQFDFLWDSAKRLCHVETKNLSSAPRGMTADYTYDALGRRIRKEVTRYEYGVGKSTLKTIFVWDGWNLFYERCATGQGGMEYERKYAWGVDVTGSIGATGGVGGLLFYTEKRGTQFNTYYPIYDTMGNVTAVTDGGGHGVAEYAWGPFGEPRAASGILAASNPFRWATRYQDDETGLYYFGHRYYDPAAGIWLSREPLGEAASLNLYAYCHNDPINNVDALGLEPKQVDARLINGVPTVIYEEWSGSGLGYLWNAFAGGETTQWGQYPDADQLARYFSFEGGVWSETSNNSRYNSLHVASHAQIAPTMERIAPVMKALEVGGAAIAMAPFVYVAAPSMLTWGGGLEAAAGRGIWFVGATASRSTLVRGTGYLIAGGLTAGAGYEIYTDPQGAINDYVAVEMNSPVPGEGTAIAARGFVRMSANVGRSAWMRFGPAMGGMTEQFLYRSGGLAYVVPPGSKSLPQVTKSGVTRTGVSRTNPADWRATRNLWDELGYGEVLSDANRVRIAAGRTPVVDDAWIAIHPEDAGLVGELIPMHHILGLPITGPLPATRHLDAHMPGGYRYNPGEIGSQLPLYLLPVQPY